MDANGVNRNSRLYPKKLFTGVTRRSLKQTYSSESESSEPENDNMGHQTSTDDLNQYERINDHQSGASTGSSGLSHIYQGSVGKITHYAESAIYKRSRGFPSLDSDLSTIPANYAPPTANHFLSNRLNSDQTGLNSSHTMERNLDSSTNSKVLGNSLLSSNVYSHLLSSNLSQDVNSCGPLIDGHRGDFDPSTTCLVRTQSGSLYIPSDGHKGLVSNTLQPRNEFTTLVSNQQRTLAPVIKSDSVKNIIHSERPPLLSAHANLLQTGIGLRGVPVSSINRGPIHGSYQIESFYETFRKSFSMYVNWRCTAITFIIISIALLFLMSYFIGNILTGIEVPPPCPVIVDDVKGDTSTDDGNTRLFRGKRDLVLEEVKDNEAGNFSIFNFLKPHITMNDNIFLPSWLYFFLYSNSSLSNITSSSSSSSSFSYLSSNLTVENDNFDGSGHLDYLDFDQYNESLHISSEDNEMDNLLITPSLPLLDEDNNILNGSNKVSDESENTISEKVFDQTDTKSNYDGKLDLIFSTGQTLNNENKDLIKDMLSGEDKIVKMSKDKQELIIPALVQSLGHLKEIIDQLSLILDNVISNKVLTLYSEENKMDITRLDNWNRLASKSINDFKGVHNFKSHLDKVNRHDDNFMKNDTTCKMNLGKENLFKSIANNHYIKSNVANTSSDDQEVMVNDKSITGTSYDASKEEALVLSSTFLSFTNDTNKKKSLHDNILDFKPSPTKMHSIDIDHFGNKFSVINMGQALTHQVPSYGHWNVQLFQRQPSLVKFNYTFPLGSSIGVYGSRNRSPSHTKYDFMEIIGIGTSKRTIRSKDFVNLHHSNKQLQSAEFYQYLDQGNWFISTFNDAAQPIDISFVILYADNSNIKCPSDCNGHGTCVMGACKCSQDFTGPNCEYQVCPILCSGRGTYHKGQCICSPGWKGKECQLREDECESSDCSGHGDCVDGTCQCFPGYKGDSCEEVDCFDSSCGGHGTCLNGICFCVKGWKGADCKELDSDPLNCLPECSGHGTFNSESGQCVCEDKWTGIDCSQEKCDLNCGRNGRCLNGRCVCLDGWGGSKCEESVCDQRCSEHGHCTNGTCTCLPGWNGKHCTLEGCPHNCNNRGECIRKENDWECVCHDDWDGHDCSVALERDCSDRIDNDEDGLIDCADSECCGSKECQSNPLCFSSADPVDVLLRKQPPSPTASFFQRMQFLIEEDSVQSYAHRKAFNDSQATVIRGQVVSPSGFGLMGVRVGVSNDPLLGFVVSRENGWFDIMVNGGSAVTLDFRREPFKVTHRTVMAPWNDIVAIGKVQMLVDDVKQPDHKSTVCIEHDYEVMKPTIISATDDLQNGCSETILQDVQESIQIAGTELNLVYHSSRASGYMSTIEIQLTPSKVPSSLRFVHLKITLEGNLFEKVFEADPNLNYTYSWGRRNAYRQKVFGFARAKVHVGYKYFNCNQIIWEVQSVQLKGHDMSISDIGMWNLDVHYRYNFHEGILQKGDGSNIYLKNEPKSMVTLIGDHEQRPLLCKHCNGPAKEQRLLAPVALTSGADGTIYIGDFNMIRRLTTDGQINTLVELTAPQVAYKYHLTMGPLDNKLYMSVPDSHQVLRVINMNDPIDLRNNLEVVVGSGIKCLPGDKEMCGDGGPARVAKLAYPKGLAMTINNEMYIADGTNIRWIDSNGIIHTLIGDYFYKLQWKPFACSGSIPIQNVNLRWPTELAINPLDNSLHILDDHIVFKVTSDKRIRIVAGRPTHCSSIINTQDDSLVTKEHKSPLATQVFLETPQSIAFSSNGDLFIAESNFQTVNRVRKVGHDGRISMYAGVNLNCSCLDVACGCFEMETKSALESKLSAIATIIVTPDGNLHVSDQGSLRVRTVISVLPQPNENKEYQIISPDSSEIYIFNRFGQHVATKDMNGKSIYTFSYNVNTSLGKLSSVTDGSSNKIYLLRDYSNQVKTIESSGGGKCHLRMSKMKMLQSITSVNGYNINFSYLGNSGLLKSRIDSYSSYSVVYNYDNFGRFISATTPSGAVVQRKNTLLKCPASQKK